MIGIRVAILLNRAINIRKWLETNDRDLQRNNGR